MKAHNCFQLVFSSSCCVYGNPERLPITEDSPIGNVTNVYGRTKYLIEEMLMDLSRSDEVIYSKLTISKNFDKYNLYFKRSVGILFLFGTLTQLEPIHLVKLAKIRLNLIPT